MRLAIFDVTHWHLPLYFDALLDAGIEIVGVTDAEQVAGQSMAARLGCPVFASDEKLLAVPFDFALVLSRHARMAALASRLMARGTPFLLEKPCGLNLAEVSLLRRQAEQAGAYVAVPFIMRVSALLAHLTGQGSLDPAGYRHLAFRFVVGPIQRYEVQGSRWMLDARLAGGGSMMNVGVHFCDLIPALTGQRIATVSARTRQWREDISVEEQAIFVVTTEAGQHGVIETGYLYPNTPADQRDFAFSVSHDARYIRGYDNVIAVKDTASLAREVAEAEYDTDRFYPVFLRRALADVQAGRSPIAGLRQAEHAIAVVEAGYRSAAKGGSAEMVEMPA